MSHIGFFSAAMDGSMTMEALEVLCNRLQVIELDNEEASIRINSMKDVVARGKNYLLMKLLSNRYHNREALKFTMTKVYSPSRAIRFHDMGIELLMVEFDNPVDKLRVLHDGLWHFDKALLLTKYFAGEQQVKNIQMREATFWVHIHNLPLMA